MLYQPEYYNSEHQNSLEMVNLPRLIGACQHLLYKRWINKLLRQQGSSF